VIEKRNRDRRTDPCEGKKMSRLWVAKIFLGVGRAGEGGAGEFFTRGGGKKKQVPAIQRFEPCRGLGRGGKHRTLGGIRKLEEKG